MGMASPITFTISTSGSGSIGALAFTDGTLTFTAVTDTTFILTGDPGFPGDMGSATSSPEHLYGIDCGIGKFLC